MGQNTQKINERTSLEVMFLLQIEFFSVDNTNLMFLSVKKLAFNSHFGNFCFTQFSSHYNSKFTSGNVK